jgi:ribosome-associated toxin RatA of RatAB toxin-antitoxin module
MAEYEYFESLWPLDKDSLFEGVEGLCDYAEAFLEWAEEVVADATTDSNLVAVNQAKVRLIDKYFEWRATVPKTHRNRVNDSGHACIFHVFEKTYQVLRATELSLRPPPLYIPEPPRSKEVIYTPLILGEEH